MAQTKMSSSPSISLSIITFNIILFISPVSVFVTIFRVLIQIFVAVTANRIVAFVAVDAGGCPHEPCIVLPVALLFRVQESAVHQPFEKRLVAVEKFYFSEFSEKQIAIHLLDFRKACMLFADNIIRHQCNAVVIAALAVVEIPFAAEIRAPVRQIMHILLLHPRPYSLLLAGGDRAGQFYFEFPFCRVLNRARDRCGQIVNPYPSYVHSLR